jgi:hypothetical protein
MRANSKSPPIDRIAGVASSQGSLLLDQPPRPPLLHHPLDGDLRHTHEVSSCRLGGRHALDLDHDQSDHTLARVAMLARNEPQETSNLANLANIARAELETESVVGPKSADIADLARQATSKARLGTERQQFGAKAKALLERLVQLQGWPTVPIGRA